MKGWANEKRTRAMWEGNERMRHVKERKREMMTRSENTRKRRRGSEDECTKRLIRTHKCRSFAEQQSIDLWQGESHQAAWPHQRESKTGHRPHFRLDSPLLQCQQMWKRSLTKKTKEEKRRKSREIATTGPRVNTIWERTKREKDEESKHRKKRGAKRERKRTIALLLLFRHERYRLWGQLDGVLHNQDMTQDNRSHATTEETQTKAKRIAKSRNEMIKKQRQTLIRRVSNEMLLPITTECTRENETGNKAKG